MGLAADHDRIARAYVTDYAEIFDFGLPVLANARRQTSGREVAVTTLHMAYLAYFPDSHIARKHGPAVAEEVRLEARGRAPLWQPVAQCNTLPRLLDFDADQRRNLTWPTADIVVATLFAFGVRRIGLSGAA
jgi:triphosphoribosyl-dephospho-CoA synthase